MTITANDASSFPPEPGQGPNLQRPGLNEILKASIKMQQHEDSLCILFNDVAQLQSLLGQIWDKLGVGPETPEQTTVIQLQSLRGAVDRLSQRMFQVLTDQTEIIRRLDHLEKQLNIVPDPATGIDQAQSGPRLWRVIE